MLPFKSHFFSLVVVDITTFLTSGFSHFWTTRKIVLLRFFEDGLGHVTCSGQQTVGKSNRVTSGWKQQLLMLAFLLILPDAASVG